MEIPEHTAGFDPTCYCASLLFRLPISDVLFHPIILQIKTAVEKETHHIQPLLFGLTNAVSVLLVVVGGFLSALLVLGAS